ncbi:MAG: transglycosylase SLT domain-containing protein [Proteobacteria bacterium]|nr:transglycosylase SLT domain-containing protein [Pseudomonadota bacterium]
MRLNMVAVAIGLLFLAAGYVSGAELPREAQQYRRDLVRNARMIWGLDAPVATFAAQIHQESGWRKDAKSAFASGLSQFTPDTAEWIGNIDPELAQMGPQPGNPVWAIRALVRYDLWLFDRLAMAGGEFNRMWASLRCYNGGAGHWLKEARLVANPTVREAVDAACGRASRSPKHCPENLGYPKRIIVTLQPLYMSWGRGV